MTERILVTKWNRPTLRRGDENGWHRIHSKKGNVDWRVAGLLAAGSVPATMLTIWVLSRVPKQSPSTAAIISMSIGVALIIAAVAIFFRRRIRDYALAQLQTRQVAVSRFSAKRFVRRARP